MYQNVTPASLLYKGQVTHSSFNLYSIIYSPVKESEIFIIHIVRNCQKLLYPVVPKQIDWR